MPHPFRRTLLIGVTLASAWLPSTLPLPSGLVRAQEAPAPTPQAGKRAATPKARARGQADKSTPPSAPLGPVHSPADLERRALPVVTYDAGEVTVGELEDAIAVSSPFAQQRALEPAALRALLDRSVRFEMLAGEAERRGYGEKEPVMAAVNQNAVQSMIKREIDAKITPQSVPSEAIKKYYQEHLNEFVRPEMRRANQILLTNEADAKALAAQVKDADMRQFRELARQKSTDETTKQRGGDLRYFDAEGKSDDRAATIDPAVVKATFALKSSGDKTGLIKTGSGWAFVMLAGMRPAHEETLKQAENRIRMRLWREQRDAAVDTLVRELKQAAQPVTHPELLDAIVFEDAADATSNKGLPSGFPHDKPTRSPKP